MRTFSTIPFVILAINLPFSSGADSQIRDTSPDGKFALLVKEQEEGHVRIQLIEAGSRSVVTDLAESGHPYSGLQSFHLSTRATSYDLNCVREDWLQSEREIKHRFSL